MRRAVCREDPKSRRSSPEPGEDSGDGVDAELGSVEGGRRQTAERLGDFLGRYAASLRGRFARQKIGEQRARGDGGHTSLRLKARLGDAIGFEAHGQAQHVATDGIRDFSRHGGIAKISGVVRIAEVFEDRVVKHSWFEYTSRCSIPKTRSYLFPAIGLGRSHKSAKDAFLSAE
jgi:hypothetical protein